MYYVPVQVPMMNVIIMHMQNVPKKLIKEKEITPWDRETPEQS